MAATTLFQRFDRATLLRLADGFAMATAASLPWSTSATGILMVLWLLALMPTLSWSELRRELLTLSGGLPVLLVLLGLVGMAWADVSLAERWKGFASFPKLLVIPLLLVQFRTSERALWVFGAYVLACIALLIVSYVLVLWPTEVFLLSYDHGVPVKNAASQSGLFVTCIFGLLYVCYDAIERRQWSWALGLVVIMLAMLANIAFVATGRTALVVILILSALFAFSKLNLRGILIFFAAMIALAALAWTASPYLRAQTEKIWTDFQKYEQHDERNSSGERIEFARKSIEFIAAAPVIGHGTGSITALFDKASAGKDGSAGSPTSNPHNQTFAVAIQIGLIGAAVLWAMWFAHLALFRGGGLVEWIGFVVVVQNIIGSLFNSHLFDFLQGWVYVIGVGVAGGVALKNRAARTPDVAP